MFRRYVEHVVIAVNASKCIHYLPALFEFQVHHRNHDSHSVVFPSVAHESDYVNHQFQEILAEAATQTLSLPMMKTHYLHKLNQVMISILKEKKRSI